MLVFKFGGASVKDAESVRNISRIIGRFDEPKAIVISAMGKTTNALERIVEHYFNQDFVFWQMMKDLELFHWSIINELFSTGNEVFDAVQLLFNQLRKKLDGEPSLTFNFEYDQVVSYGELLSTTIVSHYLREVGVPNRWIDIRKGLKTNNKYREAMVDFELSSQHLPALFQGSHEEVFVTQGFIASTPNNLTTTLGREGSDYTAALLAYFLKANSVTVWKDVPGVLNADPKWFDDTVLLPRLSYTDAIELAFYGASVIHPKTIQPLQRMKIPLYVKSFVDPDAPGTEITVEDHPPKIPRFIFKVDQVLMEIRPFHLSFIAEDNIQTIFSIFAKFGLKVNLMQNTAVSFNVCTDRKHSILDPVVAALQAEFSVQLIEPLELITIQFYDQSTIDRVLIDKEVLLEQRTQQTLQLVVRPIR